MKQASLLFLICLIYLGLSQFYQAAIPFGKGPDEFTHYLYARFISQHGRLPITPEERAATSTRAYLPPLYHLPVAVAMTLSDTDDNLTVPLKVTWQPTTRQLIDIVLSRATLIRTEDELWPYYGEYRAWVVGRWVSTSLTMGTIILTFFIVRLLLPQRLSFALAAAALIAFNPMVLFISAVLNDDSMVGLTMASYLLLLVWFLRGNDNRWLYLGLGFWIGLGVTTKYNTGLTAVSTALVILMAGSTRKWTRRATFKRIGLVWLMVLLTSSWWFLWSEFYFNQIADSGLIAGALKPFAPDVDPTANRFVSFFDAQTPDPGLPTNGIRGNFWDWLRRTFETSWALTVYGIAPYPLYWPIIILLVGLFAVSLIGLWFTWQRSHGFQKTWLMAFALHIIVVFPLPLIRFWMTYRINDSAQGRHLLFPAAPAIAILLLIGWAYWLKPTHQKPVMAFGLTGLLLWAIFHGWHLWTAYPPPLPVRTTLTPSMALAHPTEANFADILALTSYQARLLDDETLLKVALMWHSLAQAQEDYRTELVLVDEQGQTKLHWLSQPAAGRFPVRAWQAGDWVRDTLYLPLVGLSNGSYTLKLRLMGTTTPLSTTQQTQSITLSRILLHRSLRPQNEISLWQQDKPIHLTSIWHGKPTYRYRETIPVTLSSPKRLFLVDSHGQTYPPTIQTDHLQIFMVDYDWPSGDYQLQANGQITDVRLTVENFDRRQNGWKFEPPQVAHEVQANFADKIELIGYNLPTRQVKAGAGIPLVLYWRSLAQMRHDYTISVQLLDADLQRRGGYDRFPRETYNTFLWVPNEVVDDGFAVPVDADAPDGIYTIRIGWYQQQAGRIVKRLPLMQAGQPLAEDSVTIGPIKVGGPPLGVVFTEVSPQHPLDVKLGDIIALRGYDLQQAEESLRLRLYWQSIQPTATDYTGFVHLRTQSGELVAQKDQPPTAGRYPTSLWDVGEIIPDEVIIPLPDDVASPYRLMVGLYDPRSGVRLSVPNSVDDAVLLDHELEIEN